MSTRSICGFVLLAMVLAGGGCTVEHEPTPLDEAMARLDGPRAWSAPEGAPAVPRHPAQEHLEGWVIVLDPGHGGHGDRPGYKRGPTGVREAEVNMRVALLLRRLLEDAGAHVTLTREGDTDVSLARRAEIANTVSRPDGGTGADLFISLHHNAASDPSVNYSSVWFHGHADWSEPDLDVARTLAHRIGAALRTDMGRTSPLMSDQQIYNSGFGVLRRCAMPAVLIESSFHSNPEEEQRLRDADYNLHEAYAIYQGLCEYAYGGRPTQTTPSATLREHTLQITTTLNDGLPRKWWGSNRSRTLRSTIQVAIEGQRLAIDYDPKTRQLTATCDQADLPGPGRHELRVHHANLFKHHNWPQRYALVVAEEGDTLRISGVEPIGSRRYQPTPERTASKPAE